MGRVIALASGKGGTGKSLAYNEFVSLANGNAIEVGPYIDNLIENNKYFVKQLIAKTVDGREEIFEVLEAPSDLLLDVTNIETVEQMLCTEKRKPLALMRKPAPSSLLRVTSAAGAIDITPEHKFIVMRNGRICKIRANELEEKKDYLVLFCSSPEKIEALNFPTEIAELFGYLIGNGYMEGHKIHVFCADNNLLNEIEAVFQSVFGKFSKLKTRNIYRISYFNMAIIKKLYQKYGVKIATSEFKEAPEKLFEASKESVAAFIRALFDCDAHVQKKQRTIEFVSKSRKLVYQIASLLRKRFGINTQIRPTMKKANDSKKQKSVFWRLYIGSADAQRYLQQIGFKSKEKQNRLQKIIDEEKVFNTNIDVYPVGKVIKTIREGANIAAPLIAKKLGCSKQMVYECEQQYYGLSKETTLRYIKVFEELKIKNRKLDWLKWLVNSEYGFRRVESVTAIKYNKPYVYDFQISDNGGHFSHATGIIISNTTLTANLGLALAAQGHKVLLIDADIAMANLSLLLAMQSSPITLHDVLLGESNVNDAIYETHGLEFVPSGLSLESYRKIDPERLKSVVESLRDKYDYILMDAPAGIEKAVLATLHATEQVLLITEPTPPSVADCLKTKMVAQKMNSKVIGFVVNMARDEKGEIDKEEIMKMLELPCYGVVPYDEEVRKSFYEGRGQPVIIRKPGSSASKAIKKSALKLTGQKIIAEEEEEKKSKSFISRLVKKLLRR